MQKEEKLKGQLSSSKLLNWFQKNSVSHGFLNFSPEVFLMATKNKFEYPRN